MKTLLKNRRTYRNRIGTLDNKYDMVKEEDKDEESDLNGDDNNNEGNNTDNGANINNGNNTDDGNNTDSWEDMYQTEKAKDFSSDEDDSGVPEGVGEDEGNGAGVGGSKGGGGVEDGSRGVSGRKDNEGSIGTKRKNQDDKPAAKAKRMKKGSEGHQAANKSTKKALPKTRSGKKKD